MAIFWYVVIGALLVLMAISGSVLRRLPLSTSLVYLGVGLLLGKLGFATPEPLRQVPLFEHVAELAVLLSLFVAGLKLRLPIPHRAWRAPVRLALVAMLVSVGLTALAGMWLFALPLGVAVLLGAVLAPTDPVLASDVQLEGPTDTDSLRFGLTGEAGMNDGTAFPFVMLGLGLMGLHDLGTWGWRFFAVDVLWAVSAGLAVGGLFGTLVGRLVVYLRHRHREAVGLDDLLALGLIALSYGVTLAVHAYGFLAVFAAGVALRRVEAKSSGNQTPDVVMSEADTGKWQELATHEKAAPAFMAQEVLGFTQALERMAEVALMVIAGAMIAEVGLSTMGVVLAFILLCVIRPLAVLVGLVGVPMQARQRGLIAWFGIRGVGSLYYLFHALGHGVPAPFASDLVRAVLTVIAVSVVLHGISVTPLMRLYARQSRERPARREQFAQ